MAHSSREKPLLISETNSLMTPIFFYSVRTFARIRQDYFSKYRGRLMHGPSPHLKVGGGRPPVHSKSPPMEICQNECSDLIKIEYSDLV